VCSLF
jgi:hypothetical protein